MTDVVLVPGAGGAATFWHLVAAELRSAGHRPIAVDLPGPDATLGLRHYVDLTVAAISDAGDDVILVGQSLGGFTAAWAAAVVPVRELVLLNAMIPAPGETPAQWWSATKQEQAMHEHDVASGREPGSAYDADTYFLHDVPLEALAGLGDDRDEAEIVFGDPWEPEAWPDVLTRVLAGTDERFFPFAFQERVAWQRLGQDVEPVPGGHLAALSRPAEVVAAVLGDQIDR